MLESKEEVNLLKAKLDDQDFRKDQAGIND